MLYENIKNIVDVREQSFIATKHFNDKDVIDLIEYMLLKDAIIDRLTLTEGSLTKEGIEFIVTNYSHKLQELDISDNGLTDVDVESLLHLPSKSSLRTLSINNNFLSKDIISELEKCGFEHLEAENQEQLESSEKTIHTSHFTPQIGVAVLKNNSEQEVNDNKRKALDSKYSFSSFKRKKQYLPLSAKLSP